MQLHTLFTKDIARNIETVVKADDRDNIRQEIEEYVITSEVDKNLRHFFDQYLHHSTLSGVWISGFFGSGKSHLLKILSYLLSGEPLQDTTVTEVFSKKVDDALLQGDIQKAAQVPSRSLLFNIDQKATTNSRNEKTQLVDVFYKVFHDHLGYHGENRKVSDFEYWLDFDEGQYEAFKEAFARHAEGPWEKERRKYFSPKVLKPLAAACVELLGGEADDYQRMIKNIEPSSSIEDFAHRVKRYLDREGKDFRLNFFIDEVGQYIAHEQRMMLRLQTIAESLATICKGRAWMVVTAQEALDKVLADASKVESNDFTKIQDRFTKMPLTSGNVDEVIERRLLEKKEDAATSLRQMWQEHEQHILNITRFEDVKGREFRGFENEDGFVRKYPFVPYQFGLFQDCIKALSKHNAFAGKFASVGERSMLGVFKQVLTEDADKPLGHMISFDRLYDGLDQVLKSEVKSALTRAVNELGKSQPLAVKVLKALFLVKYYQEFTCTAHNAAVLTLDRNDVDFGGHQKAVQEALNLLEHQSYIERNGEGYEYLTDTERDIEQEIKNTDLQDGEALAFLQKEIYGQIIGGNKLGYQANGAFYNITQIIDGRSFGKEHPLHLHVVSPFSGLHDEPDQIRQKSNGLAHVLYLRMGDDPNLIKEIKMLEQTRKYIRRQQGNSANPQVNTILHNKGVNNEKRAAELRKTIQHSIEAGSFYLNGAPLKVTKQGAKERVVEAFQQLVETAFHRLRLVVHASYSEDKVQKTLATARDDLFGKDPGGLTQAEQEVLTKLEQLKLKGRVSMEMLRNTFSERPYGWPPPALLQQIVMLYKRSKLELEADGARLEPEEIKDRILNSRQYGSLWLEPQKDIDPQKVERLRECYQELFDKPKPNAELRDLIADFREELRKLQGHVQSLRDQKSDRFPFVNKLEDFANKLQDLSRRRDPELTEISEEQIDDLIEAKELYSKISNFVNGPQGAIYREIMEVLQQPNVTYVQDDMPEAFTLLRSLKNHPTPYQGDTLQEAKTALEAIKERLKERIEEERTATRAAIEEAKGDVRQNPQFGQLEAHEQETILKHFREPESRSRDLPYIAGLRDLRNRIEQDTKITALNEITAMLRAKAPKAPGAGEPDPLPHYVRLKGLKVDQYPKKTIENTEDLEAYLDALRRSLEAELSQNRRIHL